MGNNSFHHLLAVWQPLIAHKVHFCIFSNFVYFGKFSYQSCAKWVHIHSVSSLVNGKRFIVSFINRTAQHMFMLISTHFHWFCDIHLWNGFDWFNQSWLWHWCMPSLHLEWYYATNDSGVHFCFCNSVEASSSLKVLSLIELYEAYCCMWVFTECLLNWNEEVYNIGNKLLKCNWFPVIISWSKNFPGNHVNTL